MNTLVWHIEGAAAGGTTLAYRLDADYKPVLLWVRAQSPPDAEHLVVEVLDDGVSILPSPSPARLFTGGSARQTALFEGAVLREESVMTLRVVQGGGAQGVTVQLDIA